MNNTGPVKTSPFLFLKKSTNLFPDSIASKNQFSVKHEQKKKVNQKQKFA